MMKSTIRLGTRASKLALWQSNWVANQLREIGVDVELVEIRTTGDTQMAPLTQIGGQGVFTKRLQLALLANEIDLAVHSLKDLPTDPIDELVIAAVPPRENPADALVSNQFSDWRQLPAGSRVGTGSVRRMAQLNNLRPDLVIQEIRGNVDTRLAKLDDGQFDAIILAAAGLQRLSLDNRIRYPFPPDEMAPAVGQGALGLEVRQSDGPTRKSVGMLNHTGSMAAVTAEREMLRCLTAGCLAPVGATTSIEGESLRLRGTVLSPDGAQKIVAEKRGDLSDAAAVGATLANELLEMGAAKLIHTKHLND